MFIRRTIILILSCTAFSSCAILPALPIETVALAPEPALIRKPPVPCVLSTDAVQIFNISQDGRDIGREVRSSHNFDGPLGPEGITISHQVRRYRNETVELDRSTVYSQHVLLATKTLLRSAFVTIDESTTWLSLVGYNGTSWERIHEELESVRETPDSNPEAIILDGVDILGFELNETMRRVALGESAPATGLHFYISRMQEPISLDIESGSPATLTHNGTRLQGVRVNALRQGTNRIWLSIFVAGNRIIEEIYPALHQIRTLTTGIPTVPKQAGDPLVGMYSQTYLALPESSTANQYEIVSEQPIASETLTFIDEPDNQTLTRLSDRSLTLSVTTGGPDGTTPPSPRDLASNDYIDANSPIITGALTWLKTGGVEGNLPVHRRENAAAVIAGVSRVPSANRALWKSPDDAARLIMNYVHAILPEKQHTHTMKSASESLVEGYGDCTEHSVLFAALMRAAGFPTRLVSGIYLARGGAWVYHMWNEYWDGSRWQSIDTAVGPFFRVGAHYIALGLGVSDFADHRDKIAFFLDISFSGLAINLVSALAEGQPLTLARPSRQHFSFADATIFNATTEMRRGDMAAALAIVEKEYQPATAPLRMQLLKSELLFQNRRYLEALQMIRELRTRTSLRSNVIFLDILEFKTQLANGQSADAGKKLATLCHGTVASEAPCVVFRSQLLEATGHPGEAASLLETGMAAHPDDLDLRIAYVSLLATPDTAFSPEQSERALALGHAILLETHYADPEAFKAMTRLLFRRGDTTLGIPYLSHSLLMTPHDPALKEIEALLKERCPTTTAPSTAAARPGP